MSEQICSIAMSGGVGTDQRPHKEIWNYLKYDTTKKGQKIFINASHKVSLNCVGSMFGEINNGILHVDYINVDKNFQRKGISVELFCHLINASGGKQAVDIIRGSPASDNRSALVYNDSGECDLSNTPWARALNVLGFSAHSFDPTDSMMLSRK